MAAHVVQFQPVALNNGNGKSDIITTPLAESISRRRTYTIAQLRSDFRDAQTQFLVLLTQLHDENFSGQLTLHFSSGRILQVETVEKQKI